MHRNAAFQFRVNLIIIIIIIIIILVNMFL